MAWNGSPRAQGRRAADVELVRRALAGERASVDAFLERMACVPRMLHLKNAQLGGPLASDDLADVVQETLLAVWRKLDRYDGRARLETWVYRFCQLELLRRLRALHRLPRPLADAAARALEARGEPESAAADLAQVLEGLEGLPDELASVLRSKHLEELTFEEVGRRLGISPNTAKTRYYRGLDRLRVLLVRTPSATAARADSTADPEGVR